MGDLSRYTDSELVAITSYISYLDWYLDVMIKNHEGTKKEAFQSVRDLIIEDFEHIKKEIDLR